MEDVESVEDSRCSFLPANLSISDPRIHIQWITGNSGVFLIYISLNI